MKYSTKKSHKNIISKKHFLGYYNNTNKIPQKKLKKIYYFFDLYFGNLMRFISFVLKLFLIVFNLSKISRRNGRL